MRIKSILRVKCDSGKNVIAIKNHSPWQNAGLVQPLSRTKWRFHFKPSSRFFVPLFPLPSEFYWDKRSLNEIKGAPENVFLLFLVIDSLLVLCAGVAFPAVEIHFMKLKHKCNSCYLLIIQSSWIFFCNEIHKLQLNCAWGCERRECAGLPSTVSLTRACCL